MKKALIFDPYLDTLGGGERYTLSVAQVLVKAGYKVDLAWSDPKTLDLASTRFGLNLQVIKPNPTAYQFLSTQANLVKKALFTRQYDLIFFLSDGSIPLLFAKKTLLHLQTPFPKSANISFIDKLKLVKINKIIYNSAFTQSYWQKYLPKNKGVVIYPPIDTDSFKPSKIKENIILSVGRFDSPSHPKRQDVLISAFVNLPKNIQSKYKLILVGGLVGNKSLLKNLKAKAQKLNVEFIVNPNFKTLQSLYAKAKIFWHAAGFEIDEQKNPDKVEHFGMTTVEAMSAGCVPTVCNKGGQKEIVTSGTGFLWNTIPELVNHTLQLIKSPSLIKRTANKAIKRSKDFGLKTFETSLKQII
ncbi:glycosyltransferase family 4 protein [Patescibacteria group bacterium]|nr:glycosyltransferase family 4 protein [Patescibacteria group bacterium]